MKTLCLFLRGLAVCAFAGPLFANAVPISASASYLGLTSTWQFNYTVGAPDLFLQAITIDLSPTNVRFDTAPGGFGSLGNAGVVTTAGTTGLIPGYTDNATLDGLNTLTFTFADFNPGETFSFSADLDHFPNPTLGTLANCSALPFAQRPACIANNLLITANNAALLLAADAVTSAQVAGAQVRFQFGGPDYDTVTLSAAMQAATLPNIINGLLTGQGINSFGSGGTASTPEPATLFPCATCFFLLALYARRRRV